MPPRNLCPCTSGRPYRECCAPFHRGEAEPPDCDALVRSRFSAFALHDAAYLWKTLDPESEDRARPEAEALRAIKLGATKRRFMRLTLMDRRPADEEGFARVLFCAEVFERGRDLSFVELSRFRHDGTGWRYRDGKLLPAASLKPVLHALTIEGFERVLRASPG